MTGWLDRRERAAIAYLMEDNRLLQRHIGGRRLRLTDDDRRRLAVRAYRLGREVLRDVATIVTPDTLLRSHRQLVARRWTYARKRASRGGALAEIRHLVVQYLPTALVGLVGAADVNHDSPLPVPELREYVNAKVTDWFTRFGELLLLTGPPRLLRSPHLCLGLLA